MKRTPWFDGSVKPARDGVYERLWPAGQISMSRFKSGLWRRMGVGHCFNECIDRASTQEMLSKQQALPWRGLTKEAK